MLDRHGRVWDLRALTYVPPMGQRAPFTVTEAMIQWKLFMWYKNEDHKVALFQKEKVA